LTPTKYNTKNMNEKVFLFLNEELKEGIKYNIKDVYNNIVLIFHVDIYKARAFLRMAESIGLISIIGEKTYLIDKDKRIITKSDKSEDIIKEFI